MRVSREDMRRIVEAALTSISDENHSDLEMICDQILSTLEFDDGSITVEPLPGPEGFFGPY